MIKLNKKKIVSMVLIFLMGIAIGCSVILLQNDEFKAKSFKEKRNEILSEIDFTLREATESGNYACCIEPPCKMCFLGNWIWDDGTCVCDGMMLQDEWDKVCPECKAGIREGRCISTKRSNETCPVFNESE